MSPALTERVRVCHRCTKCSWRSFFRDSPDCPEHGKTASFTDLNRPYFGKPVPQAPSFDKDKFIKGMEAQARNLKAGSAPTGAAPTSRRR